MRAIAQWIFRSMPGMAGIRQEGLKITFSTSLSTSHRHALLDQNVILEPSMENTVWEDQTLCRGN